MTFEREIKFDPAYDRSAEGYGTHGVNMRWYLKGEKGIVQFVVYTNWHLPHKHKEYVVSGKVFMLAPMPADVGYHSPVKIHGHETEFDDCSLMPDGKCYYDGSGLQAESLFQILVSEGDEAVWQYMEDYYRRTFENDYGTVPE